MATDQPQRCETCAHWRRLRNNHRIGRCQAALPLPFWAERDRRNGSDYTFPDDGGKCPIWKLADTPPISPAT